jgi:tricorn protease
LYPIQVEGLDAMTTAVLLLAGLGLAADAKPLLLQRPTVSHDRIAFSYAGDLWVVDRGGGDARRLTTGVGLETDPFFSPDGSQIVFSGEYGGNLDVYIVAAAGGEPKRLTYHPGPDLAVGWTPDGQRVLFRSGRASESRFERLFTVGTSGGLPEELPLPLAEEGSYSPGADRIAYVPFWNRRATPTAYISWKRYRGGKASPIWIADLSDSRIEKIPREDSNDFCPMWIGRRVYFLSDRDGTVTLYSFDVESKQVKKALPNDEGADILSASAGPGAIVFGRLGSVHLFDIESGQARPVAIRVAGDMPQVQPRYAKAEKRIQGARISPSGVRAAFAARGEIVTVPAEKGDIRNLTRTAGACERDPAWSPDGKQVAYFSDASGEYALHIRQQDGLGETKLINLGDPPSFFYRPTWSPDGKKITYTDKRLGVWYVDLDKGTPVRIDVNAYDSPVRTIDPAWSPDSRWIAYTKQLNNHLRAVFVYSVQDGKARQVTDGRSDARYAAFDKDGKHLYFTASTDVGPTTGWLDMSSMNRPVTRSVYVAVLDKTLASPLAPESDEEKPEAKDEKDKDKDKAADKQPASAKIDFDDIDQRILALPIPPRNYAGLAAGKAGELFLLEAPTALSRGPEPKLTLHKFDMKKRKAEKLLEEIAAFDLSQDGSKLLYKKGDNWLIAATADPTKEPKTLKTAEIEIPVDPRAEWRQMYREVWRIERDYLYDPGAHGLDLKAAERRYEPYLEGIAGRDDLNYLFNDMLGELVLGHTYVGGGDAPEPPKVKGGLLGADFRVENGRYRIVRIYRGENWNPELKAPLTQPGVDVKVGDYLLAVDGREIRTDDDPYRPFEATAGKAVVLRVGPDPGGANARDVTVVPIESDTALRNLSWIEANRRKVDALSGGRVAYVYLPNTSFEGFTRFNRDYFAQVDKEGAVIDERYNGGGTAADYIVDYLHRPLMNYWTTREGRDFTTPLGSIFGPKVMLINEAAGSGGDALPWYFRKAGLGPLVGTRTWGGLVGVYDYPPLMDGGAVSAPRMAFWNPDGTWDVENRGVAPDIEVELDPRAVRAGHDPQLERAVALALDAMAKNPPPRHKRPAYPDYHKGP